MGSTQQHQGGSEHRPPARRLAPPRTARHPRSAPLEGARVPLAPALPGAEFKPEAAPASGEPVYTKDVNSAFIGTTLDADLRARRHHEPGGGRPHHGSLRDTTVRMAGNLGYRVWVAADACATFDRIDHTGRPLAAEEIHRAALASLHGEFATVADTDALVSLARSSG